jgi:hypothetical protein
VRRSEFDRAVEREFGARGAMLVSDLGLPDAGGLTAREALDQGVPPRDVWLALCVEMDVPESHRHGAGRQEPHARR